MKQIHIYILIIFNTITVAFAQKIDTSNVGTTNLNFVTDSASYAGYNFAKTSPFYIKSLMPSKFNNLTATHSFEKGGLTLAQMPKKLSFTNFSTEGISQLQSVSIWGQFSYQRVVEDSVSFAHQTRNNIANPYYFGSQKSVSYQRALYNLKALASRNFINNNLPIGLGVDYRIGNHYSTNDPRGDIGDFQLNLIGTIGYHFTKQLSIGAGYRYGYGLEKVNVAYKNASLSQGSLIPEFNNYLISGYGEPEIFNTRRTFQNNSTRNGIDAYLTYNNDNFGNFNLSYQSIKEKQDYNYRTSVGIEHFVNFNIVNEQYRLLWLKNLGKNSVSVELGYQTNTGDNYVLKYLANSYLFKNNNINAKAIYTLKQNQYIHNFVGSLSKYEEQKIDGIAGNNIQFNRLNYNLGYSINHTDKNSHNLGIGISGFYTQYLDSQFNVLLLNEGSFTKDVIYHDYAYNTAARYGGSLSANYNIPLFTQIHAGVKITSTYMRRGELQNINRTLTSVPGKDRFFNNISLNLYF